MQKERSHIKLNGGFALIDVLVSAGILIVSVGALTGAIMTSQRLAIITGDRNRAIFLAEQGLEAARNLRDSGYANLPSGTYGLSATPDIFSNFQDPTDMYTQMIQVTAINATTKQVVSTVTWTDYVSSSVSVTTYLVDPTLLGMAGNVVVNTAGAVHVGLLGTSISGITITNNGPSAVTVKSTTLGGVITTNTTVVAPGATVALGTLSVPLVGGLLPSIITFADNSTKTFTLSI